VSSGTGRSGLGARANWEDGDLNLTVGGGNGSPQMTVRGGVALAGGWHR
jgi:hypothetical protein